MTSSRRHFIRQMGTGFAAAGSAVTALACTPPGGGLGPREPKTLRCHLWELRELCFERDPDQVEPAPLGYDRLPLEWHQERARALKTRVADRGRRGHPPLQRSERRLLHGLLPGKRGALHLDPLPHGRRRHGLLVFSRHRSGPHPVVVVHGERVLLLLSPRRRRFPEPGPGGSRSSGGPLRVDAGGAEEARLGRRDHRHGLDPVRRPGGQRQKGDSRDPVREHPGRLPGHAAGEDARGAWADPAGLSTTSIGSMPSPGTTSWSGAPT